MPQGLRRAARARARTPGRSRGAPADPRQAAGETLQRRPANPLVVVAVVGDAVLVDLEPARAREGPAAVPGGVAQGPLDGEGLAVGGFEEPAGGDVDRLAGLQPGVQVGLDE